MQPDHHVIAKPVLFHEVIDGVAESKHRLDPSIEGSIRSQLAPKGTISGGFVCRIQRNTEILQALAWNVTVHIVAHTNLLFDIIPVIAPPVLPLPISTSRVMKRSLPHANTTRSTAQAGLGKVPFAGLEEILEDVRPRGVVLPARPPSELDRRHTERLPEMPGRTCSQQTVTQPVDADMDEATLVSSDGHSIGIQALTSSTCLAIRSCSPPIDFWFRPCFWCCRRQERRLSIKTMTITFVFRLCQDCPQQRYACLG
mmetsp:Transcript_10551/g.29084  ORF Transcript_10551/g.29084 Transcript_10551/m.29084 type:complete len:256 (-) Transcript_10551:84-851(-)